MYIKREFQDYIKSAFETRQQFGLILGGIVGCGKTTLIEELLKTHQQAYSIFTYSGDDVKFREAVRNDTNYIFNDIKAHTHKPTLIFVDEVQKCEEVFDALKVAFDKAQAKFIVTGSNPAYLDSEAKKRLQRRAEFMKLMPFSLRELLCHGQYFDLSSVQKLVEHILWEPKAEIAEKEFQIFSDLTDQLKVEIKNYLTYGGLPLAYLANTEIQKFTEIKKITERGFDAFMHESNNISDKIKLYLADLHSKEFSFHGFFQTTGLRRRDIVNQELIALNNHGYIVSKKPFFPNDTRRSYLTTYSYIDPGIVNYLMSSADIENRKGYLVEGYVHARLTYLAQFHHFPTELYYYKDYVHESDEKIKFNGREIDFILKVGKKILPIEVKSRFEINGIDSAFLEAFVHKHKCPYGLLLYGGLPYYHREKKILFFPFWAL